MSKTTQPIEDNPTVPLLDLSTLFIDASISKDYAEHRTFYSDEVFQVIADYCREILPNLTLAVDVGCGPGNSTTGLTKHFEKVIGVDISETQIAAAPNDIPNAEFKVASSQNLPFLETGSVDLFASGLAFNFMPQKETFAEADRVLKPGGTIAIFGYGAPKNKDDRLNNILKQGFEVSKNYLPKQCFQPLEDYRGLELPYPGWIKKENIKFSHTMSTEGILSMCRLMQKILDDFVKPADMEKTYIQQMEEAFASIKPEERSETYTMEYDCIMLLAHKPL